MSQFNDLSDYRDKEGNALLPYDMLLGLYRERDYYVQKLRPQDWDEILGEFPEFREGRYPTKFGDFRNLDQIVRDNSGFCLTRETIEDFLDQTVRGPLPVPPPAPEPVLPPELLLEVKDHLPANWQDETVPPAWSDHAGGDTQTPADAEGTGATVHEPRQYIFLCSEEDEPYERPALEQVPGGQLYGFGSVLPRGVGPITSCDLLASVYPFPNGPYGLLGNLFKGNVDVRHEAHNDNNDVSLQWYTADVIAAGLFNGGIMLLVRSKERAANRDAPAKAISLRKRLWSNGSRHIVWRDRITYTAYTGSWLYKNTQVVVLEPHLNTHLTMLGQDALAWNDQTGVFDIASPEG